MDHYGFSLPAVLFSSFVLYNNLEWGMLLRTPEGGAPGTAHEGRGESRELNDTITEWKRVPHIHVVRRVNEII